MAKGRAYNYGNFKEELSKFHLSVDAVGAK